MVSRFAVTEAAGASSAEGLAGSADQGDSEFVQRARIALAAFAARPGFRRGRVGRSVDEPTEWVLVTEWDGVGAYRRALSAYQVRVDATTLLAQARDEPGAFEVLIAVDGPGAAVTAAPSDRAADAVSEAPRPVTDR